jgi:hypothetical protein
MVRYSRISPAGTRCPDARTHSTLNTWSHRLLERFSERVLGEHSALSQAPERCASCVLGIHLGHIRVRSCEEQVIMSAWHLSINKRAALRSHTCQTETPLSSTPANRPRPTCEPQRAQRTGRRRRAGITCRPGRARITCQPIRTSQPRRAERTCRPG